MIKVSVNGALGRMGSTVCDAVISDTETELIDSVDATAAALDAANRKEEEDDEQAAEGEGIDLNKWDADSNAQNAAIDDHNAAKEALKKFRVANAAILATIKMRPKNAGQESNAAQSQTE